MAYIRVALTPACFLMRIPTLCFGLALLTSCQTCLQPPVETSKASVTIGIKIPKDLDLKTFSVEQHRLFKLAVSMYVKNLFPDFSPFADSLRFEVDDQLWLKSPKEEDRRAKLQTALGFDGKYELTLEADGAGCVPVNPDCTDERKCEWESNRIYSVMKNDAQICCGKWVIDKYNALSKGRGYDPIGQNHKVGTLPIVVYHRVTFLPPPRKPK